MHMISVVIPEYNEEERIVRCLGSYEDQDVEEDFEVIVVDNASTDRTAEIARSYAQKINLRIITESKKGRGAARRRGFLEARGEIILSTDADCAAPKNWISVMAAALRNSQGAAISGGYAIEDLPRSEAMVFNIIQSSAARLYRIYFHHWWLYGFNFGIYKKIYDQSGGFNADLNAQEDIDLSMRVSALGRIKFIPKIKIFFSGRRFNGGVMRGLKPYQTTFVQLYRREEKDIHLDDPR